MPSSFSYCYPESHLEGFKGYICKKKPTNTELFGKKMDLSWNGALLSSETKVMLKTPKNLKDKILWRTYTKFQVPI
jgi:hypothetical protein